MEGFLQGIRCAEKAESRWENDNVKIFDWLLSFWLKGLVVGQKCTGYPINGYVVWVYHRQQPLITKPQIMEVVSNFCDEDHCYFEILGEDVHIQYIERT